MYYYADIVTKLILCISSGEESDSKVVKPPAVVFAFALQAHVVQACSPSTCKSGWDFIKSNVESRFIISCNADFWRAGYISGRDGTCQERQTTAVIHFDNTDTLVLYMGKGQISAPQSANMTLVDVFSVCGLLLN